MSNTPLHNSSSSKTWSGFTYVVDDASLADLNGNTIRLSDAQSGPVSDGPSGDGALFDWMSDEGLLDWVTCEANCD